jgi:hypothetical protein
MPESINNADLWVMTPHDMNLVINLDMTSVMPEACALACQRYTIDAPDDDLKTNCHKTLTLIYAECNCWAVPRVTKRKGSNSDHLLVLDISIILAHEAADFISSLKHTIAKLIKMRTIDRTRNYKHHTIVVEQYRETTKVSLFKHLFTIFIDI